MKGEEKLTRRGAWGVADGIAEIIIRVDVDLVAIAIHVRKRKRKRRIIHSPSGSNSIDNGAQSWVAHPDLLGPPVGLDLEHHDVRVITRRWHKLRLRLRLRLRFRLRQRKSGVNDVAEETTETEREDRIRGSELVDVGQHKGREIEVEIRAQGKDIERSGSLDKGGGGRETGFRHKVEQSGLE